MRIKMYKYIGEDPHLKGHRALGMIMDGTFKVQVNDRNHHWAYGWWATPESEWELDG